MLKEIKPFVVSFKQAVWLKRKGFDIITKQYFKAVNPLLTNENLSIILIDNIHKENYNFISYCSLYLAPEQWQVIEWLRVKYGIWITVTSISQESWQWHITKPGDSLGKLYEEDFYSPQEAYNAAFDYIRENNLI